jgi:uncharacterized protein (TIRG00374 family)
MTIRRLGLLIAQTLLGAALLAAWLWVVDLEAIGRILGQARWSLVVLTAALWIGSGAMRALRWRTVLRPIAWVPVLDLWLISLAANLVNFVIPLRTGEVARSLFLRQRHRVSFAASLPTVAVDRAFDLAALLALGAAGALLGVRLDNRLSLVILAGGVLLLAFVAFVGLTIRGRLGLLTVLTRILPRRLGDSLRGRIVETGEAFLLGFSAAAQRPRDLALMVLLSLVAIIVDATGLYLLFLSLAPPATFTVIVTGFALLTLTYLIPGAPGYIGSTEAFGSLFFTSLGIETELAASAVLLNHAVTSAAMVSLGGVALWALGLRPASTLRSFLAGGGRASAQAQPGAES